MQRKRFSFYLESLSLMRFLKNFRPHFVIAVVITQVMSEIKISNSF